MVVSNWLLNQRGETESWSSRNCLRLPEQAGDEELERQIRLLLISSYNPAGVKTTWHCSQCGFSCELQYSVKQHIETHITTVVHQCTSPKNTEDKECSESTHEPEARVEAPSKLC